MIDRKSMHDNREVTRFGSSSAQLILAARRQAVIQGRTDVTERRDKRYELPGCTALRACATGIEGGSELL